MSTYCCNFHRTRIATMPGKRSNHRRHSSKPKDSGVLVMLGKGGKMINPSRSVKRKKVTKKDVTTIKLRLNTIILDNRLLVPIEERVIYTSMVSVRGGEFLQRAVIEYCENPDASSSIIIPTSNVETMPTLINVYYNIKPSFCTNIDRVCNKQRRLAYWIKDGVYCNYVVGIMIT